MELELESKIKNSNPKQIVFGGCGGLYNYFLGISNVVQKKYNLENTKFGGASAGNLAAIVLSADYNVDDVFYGWNKEMLKEVDNKWCKGLFNWNKIVKKHCMDNFEDDIHHKLNDKLHMSLTHVKGFNSYHNEIVNKWHYKEDVIDCFLASGFIPIFDTQFLMPYRGKYYFDGAYTNSRPIPDENIEHIYFDVNQWRDMKWHWKIPSSDFDWCEKLYRWGNEDASDNLSNINI